MAAEIVDKMSIGTTGVQYHVGVKEGDISDIVLMPGDPFRVQLIADRLENAVEVAHKREYRTVTGYYKGRKITACSSGMGCPSTAIGVEELARVGGRVFIRVGSTAATQAHINVGDLVISEGSFRNDGTTAAYVPAGFPAVPDFELTLALINARTYRWKKVLQFTQVSMRQMMRSMRRPPSGSPKWRRWVLPMLRWKVLHSSLWLASGV